MVKWVLDVADVANESGRSAERYAQCGDGNLGEAGTILIFRWVCIIRCPPRGSLGAAGQACSDVNGRF